MGNIQEKEYWLERTNTQLLIDKSLPKIVNIYGEIKSISYFDSFIEVWYGTSNNIIISNLILNKNASNFLELCEKLKPYHQMTFVCECIEGFLYDTHKLINVIDAEFPTLEDIIIGVSPVETSGEYVIYKINFMNEADIYQIMMKPPTTLELGRKYQISYKPNICTTYKSIVKFFKIEI